MPHNGQEKVTTKVPTGAATAQICKVGNNFSSRWHVTEGIIIETSQWKEILKKWKSEMKKSIGSLKLHLKNDSIKEAGYCCSHLLHRLLTKAHEMTSEKVEVILIRQPESHKRDVVQRKQSYVYEESRSAEVLILIPAARILSISPHHRASVRDLWTGVSCKCRCTSSAAPLLTH